MSDMKTVLTQALEALRLKYSDVIYEQSRELARRFESDIDAAQASQAAQQEPVAWHVCSVNSDGSLSLEHAAMWREAAHEHISDAINSEIDGAASWVVRPVFYSAPVAPARQPLTSGERSLLYVKRFGPSVKTAHKLYLCHLTIDGFDAIVKDVEAAHEITGDNNG